MPERSSVRLRCTLLSLAAWAICPVAQGASSAELKVQLGHSSTVKSVAISSDGHWVLSGSWDKTARLWELSTGHEIRRFEGHSDWLTSVAFSPDGRSVLTASHDKTARLWDVAAGREIRRFQHLEAVRAAVFAPDGRSIATGSEDKTARLWDVDTGKEVRRFEGHSDKVTSLAFSPDGRLVLTGSDDTTARLWDVDTGREVRRFEGHASWVASLAFSPDGRLVLTGSDDKTAQLWEADTGREVHRFQGLSYGVTCVAFAPDGHSAFIAGIGAVLGNPGDARLWDVVTGREIRRFNQGGWTTSAAFAPDGRSIVTSNSDDSPRLWDVATGREIRSFAGHSDSVASVAFAPDGRSVFTGSADKTSPAGALIEVARLWDLETGREVRRLEGSTPWLKAMAFSPDGRSVLTTNSDNSPRLWDVASGREIRRFEGHSQAVEALAFSPDGRWLLTGSRDKTARLWDVAMGREAGRFDHADRVDFVTFSPDGRSFVTGSADYKKRLWDVATRREIHRFEGYSRLIFSPDSKFVLIADKTARLYDAATGTEIRRFEGPPKSQNRDPLTQKLIEALMSVDFAAFSPDGRAVFTARSDQSTELWDVATGRKISRLEGHSKRIRAVAFAPDSRSLVTGSEDGTARLWDPATGREIHRFEGHSSRLNSVAFSPDGRFVISGSDDGASKIWNRSTGLLLATLIGFREGGWAVVDPEGRYDASDPDNAPGLYWQLGDEVIELKQLKDRFYAPNLLARTLGFNSEPLPRVVGLNNLELWPIVQVKEPAPGQSVAHIRLSDRGGGIGRVVVKVNGREIPLATGGTAIDANIPIPIDLSGAELTASGENSIEVIAYDKGNLVAARGVQVAWSKAPDNAAAPPVLHAILAGASSYENPAMSLRFPAKDARDMARALAVGGKRMFGVGRVDITVFATGAHEPTKENIRDAFKAIPAKAGPNDVVLVYLAGHGVAGRAGSDLYYYLTRDARSVKLEDDATLWERTTISSAELREWLSRKGMPLRQVVVLDTCAAGAATAELLKLADRRELTADQRRALELLKDATGSHLLMGAAADKASYEASRYGQGLLTYSLLLGMRGEALDAGGRLDVGKWFDTAQRKVPELAQGIGGIQQPVVSSPSGQTFPIALFTPEDQAQIHLPALKPQLVRARVEDEEQNDPLQLDVPVRAGLRAASLPMTRGETRAEPPMVYMDQVAGDVADAYAPQVRYTDQAGVVQVRLRLVRGQERVERTLRAARPDSSELAKRIVDEFLQMVISLKP